MSVSSVNTHVNKVFVSSATSATGGAAIDHLLKSDSSVIVRAGVRDVSKANKRFPNIDSKRLSFTQIEVKSAATSVAANGAGNHATSNNSGSVSQIASELKGFDRLILIPPQEYADRFGVVKAYIDAAKVAGIPHITLVSAPAAETTTFILGKTLHSAEQLLRDSGISYTILRAVFFYENQFGNAQTIKANGMFFQPFKSTIAAPQLSVSDIGAAAASVALTESVNKSKHHNKSYTIVGDVRTWDEVAQAYTKAIGKSVKYVEVSNEAAINAMKAFMPENIAKGIVELNRDFEAAKPGTYSTVELHSLLGRAPESFEEWVTKNAAAFNKSHNILL